MPDNTHTHISLFFLIEPFIQADNNYFLFDQPLRPENKDFFLFNFFLKYFRHQINWRLFLRQITSFISDSDCSCPHSFWLLFKEFKKYFGWFSIGSDHPFSWNFLCVFTSMGGKIKLLTVQEKRFTNSFTGTDRFFFLYYSHLVLILRKK